MAPSSPKENQRPLHKYLVKMYLAKVVVFVDDRICERTGLELSNLLSQQVKVEASYLEKEFGVYVRPVWSGLQDNTSVLSEDNKRSIEKTFGQE